MPSPCLRGTAFAPNLELYAIDSSNRLLERHVQSKDSDGYVLASTKAFRGRPLAITYMSVKTGFDFDGVVLTLDTRNIRFVSCPNLEIRRTVYSYGRCTAITAVPDTQSLLVVNSETSSVDVINIYGVPMKRFDLPDIVNCGINTPSPTAVGLTTIGNREIVIVTTDSGLHVMSVDIDKSKTLILTPRQLVKKTDTFLPLGLAALENLLFVVNGAENDPKLHRYNLSLKGPVPEDVVLTPEGEMGESDPLSLCMIKLNKERFRLGGSRRHDNARGYDLLFRRDFDFEEE